MNKFELLGRVGAVEIKYSERTGKPITTVVIGIPNGKTTEEGKKLYDNFFIIFFNTEKSPTAENLAENVNVGDYIRVSGKLTIDKYKRPDEDKFTYAVKLIGFGFKKVKYDDVSKKYIDVEDDN